MFSIVHLELPKTAVIRLPRIEMLDRLTEHSFLFSFYNGRRYRRCDCGGDLILDYKNVRQIAVVS